MLLLLASPLRHAALRLPAERAAPIQITQTSDCFTLSKGGFPLPTNALLKDLGWDKAKYFKHIKSLGYDETLHVVQKGTVEKFDKCLGDMEKTFIVFVGDCMARQSFEAFNQIGSHGDRVSFTPAEVDMLEIMSLDVQKSAELSLPRYVAKANSAYVPWHSGNIAEFLQECQHFLDESGLVPSRDNVMIWAGYDIHTFFAGVHGDFGPFQDRRLKLKELVTRSRQSFPGVRVAWMTANHLDLDIMGSFPQKREFPRFVEQGVKKATENHHFTDEEVMQALNVTIVPRYQVSTTYAGVQCDGIHNNPHNIAGDHSESWGCPRYPAVEDLIVRAGIASLCSPGYLPICAPTGA